MRETEFNETQLGKTPAIGITQDTIGEKNIMHVTRWGCFHLPLAERLLYLYFVHFLTSFDIGNDEGTT